MTIAKLERIARTRTYKGLVQEFPPRPIHARKAVEEAYRVIDRLMSVEHPSADQLEFLELLATLVETYEAVSHPTPVTSLRSLVAHLIDAKGVNQATVARDAGVSPSTLSDVLAGRRALSRENIKRLSRYFRVPPAAFLEAPLEEPSPA